MNVLGQDNYYNELIVACKHSIEMFKSRNIYTGSETMNLVWYSSMCVSQSCLFNQSGAKFD